MIFIIIIIIIVIFSSDHMCVRVWKGDVSQTCCWTHEHIQSRWDSNAVGVWTATCANLVWNLRVSQSPAHRASNVQRSIRRTHVTHSYQQNIDEGPDAQTTKTEELPQTFSPLTQIEAIRTEPTQSNAVELQKHDDNLWNMWI